ncbi:MAG: ABC transporter permease [Anaerolineae bacterium]|nr:ABC transporter permease [Anaerolineae bacterium]
MLRPRWKKLLADLWGNKSRTLLVVASIAVGVFAIGVIAGTYVFLQHDMNASYVASNAANITLLTRPFTHDLVDAVARMESVAAAEGVRELTARVRPVASDTTGSAAPQTHAEWDSLLLMARPDYADIEIHRRFPVDGAAVPDDEELILEHQTLAALGIAIGDRVELEMSDGSSRVLTVVGTAMDQSDPYSVILGDLRGYTTLETLNWLRASPTMTKLLITVAGDGDDKAHIRDVSQSVTDRLEKSGYPVYQTAVAGTHEHPLGGIIRALLLVLIIVGVLIVLLSSSLIANTMSALLTQHMRQIGVMKLVGARRYQVVGIYILLIMTFGAIALLMAIPLGSVGAYALSRFAASIINFQLRPFQLIPQAIAIQVAIGLLLPPIAGLVPVLRGSQVTVREALSSTGLGSAEGHKGPLNRLLARVRGVARPVLISLRNTFRRKKRLLLTLFTLTLGGAIFIGVFNTQVSMDKTVEAMTRYFGADVTLTFAEAYRIDEVGRELSMVPGVVGFEVWATTGADLLRDDGTPPDTLAVIAPPADSALIEPKLIEGRWLMPGDRNVIAVNEAIWDEFPDFQAGDTLRLELAGREDIWTVAGIFQYTGGDDLVAYAAYEHVAGLLKEPYHASSYRLVTSQHSLAYQELVRTRVSAHFRDLGYRVEDVQAGKQLTESIPSLLGIITKILLVMALMTALVGSIGLAGTMGMNVMERTREIGVMRAIGAHNAIILRLVIAEGLIIGLISYVVGSVLAFPIGAALSQVITMAIFGTPAELGVTAQGFLIWLGIVLALSVLASLIPARNASRLTIREVLAYE